MGGVGQGLDRQPCRVDRVSVWAYRGSAVSTASPLLANAHGTTMLPGQCVRRIRRAAISAVWLALSVATPLVERADYAHAAAIEGQQHSESCPRAHDHTICAQVGGNLSLPAVLSAVSLASPVLRFRLTRRPGAADPRILTYGHPTRAPPTV
jgi:hypothetical protein